MLNIRVRKANQVTKRLLKSVDPFTKSYADIAIQNIYVRNYSWSCRLLHKSEASYGASGGEAEGLCKKRKFQSAR